MPLGIAHSGPDTENNTNNTKQRPGPLCGEPSGSPGGPSWLGYLSGWVTSHPV